jgi:hypothetical protein
LNQAVPSALDDACMQALRAREERFQNARAFADALEHAIDDAGILVARPRSVALLTEGLRPNLMEESAPVTPAPITPAEGATTHTATLDVASADLPLAARPVTVTTAARREASAVEGDATSASLVAPVQESRARRTSTTPGRVAMISAAAALLLATGWLVLRNSGTSTTVRSDASSEAASATASIGRVTATPVPPPAHSAVPASAPAPSPLRPAPAPHAALPHPAGKVAPTASPSAAPSAQPAPRPVSSVLHPDRL